MPLDAPSETTAVISTMEFERERDLLWKGLNPANNPDRLIRTKSFAVERDERGPHLDHTDIIESISPDIHVVTASCDHRDGPYFMLTVTGEGVNMVVCIDTDDTTLATEVHLALLARFEETRSLRDALIWLVEEGKYSGIKGRKKDSLLRFAY